MILLAVAVVCGLAASVAVSKLMNLKLFANRDEDPTVEVWVAKDDIKQLTVINEPETLFERKRLKKEGIARNVLVAGNAEEQLKSKLVTRSLSKGHFLTQKDLDKQVLVLTAPPGKQLLAIPASAEAIAGGFVLPNSHVDIIWTAEDPRRPNGRKAQIKLQDILVLAVDHTTERQPDAKGPSVVSPSTVTLAVSDADAKRLGFLKENGKLRLILRGPEDKEMAPTKGAISAQDPDMPEEEEPVVVEVPVARDYLPAKTRLEEKLFVTKKFPERPRDALTLDDIRKGDKVLKQPVSAGEFVSKAVDVSDGKEPSTTEGPGSEPDKRVPPNKKKPGRKMILIDGNDRRDVDVGPEEASK
jgi:pilus assembly protein CpaB